MLLAVVRVHEHWWPPVKAVRVGVGLKKESYLIQGQLGHAETNIHCIWTYYARFFDLVLVIFLS